MAAAQSAGSGADDHRVAAEQLRPLAVRAVEEVPLAGVGEAGGEVAVHRGVVADHARGEQQGAPAPRLPLLAGEEEIPLLGFGLHHVAAQDLGPHLQGLSLQPLLDLGAGRSRHPGHVPELLQREEEGTADAVDHQRLALVPGEMERRRQAGGAAADDQGVVKVGHGLPREG